MERTFAGAVCAAVLGVTAACSSSSAGAMPASDAGAVHLCRHTDFGRLGSHGVGFHAVAKPQLVRAYSSTGRALTTWDWSEQEGPRGDRWPKNADSRAVAVCYFDGAFRTDDGRTYARALVETDGARFRLVVADERERVEIVRPPGG